MSTPAQLSRMLPIIVLLGFGLLEAARAAPAVPPTTSAAFSVYLPQIRVDPTGAVRPDLPGTIAFVHDGDIYAYQPRTGAIRLLIPNGREVEFSRDGTQLAFVRDDGLYVAAADGSNIRRVVTQTAVSAPHWTDDGSKLVWERSLDPTRWWAGNEIWTLVLAGGTPTKIAVGFDPAWAPDGLRVAYVTALPDQYTLRNELHLVNWRGQNDWAVVTRLPANTPPIGFPGSKVPPEELAHRMRTPVWDATGTAIYVPSFVLYQALAGFGIWERADARNGGSVFLSEGPEPSDVITSPDRRAALVIPAEDGLASARSLDPAVPDAAFAWAEWGGGGVARAWSPNSNAVAVFGCPQECGLVLLTPNQDEPSLLIRGIVGSEVSWGR